MTLSIEIPEELGHKLAAEAEIAGEALPDYATRVIARGLAPHFFAASGAEIVAYWQRHGVIGSRPDITDPSAHARDLRERAERRERE